MTSLIPSPYQLIHLMKLKSNKHNCLLIADGVGVGKTISSGYIIFNQSVVFREPVVIVCPPILVDKWRHEMKSKFGIETRAANNRENFDLMLDEIKSGTNWETGPVYVTTYSLLSRLNNPVSPSVGLVVMDEIHTAKNPETRLYPVLKELCKNSTYRVGLSATPINNSTSDLASIMSLLLSEHSFDDLDSMLEDLWGLPLVESISCITTRFTKDQVASHFTIRDIHNIEIEYTEAYTSFVKEKIAERYPLANGFQFETISMHRLAASSPPSFMKALGTPLKERRADPKLEKLLDLLYSKPDEKWLIFTEFKETAEYISKNIPKRLVLQTSGDSKLEQREANTFLFRETESSVMIMTPVGSEGLDFQFCSNLVNYDLHWNPMKIEQRIGRIDRIGQEKDIIGIYNFSVLGSIDERVRSVMGHKLDLVSGTFADVPRIIKPKHALLDSNIGKITLDRETKSAKSLIKSAKFYNQISSSDHDASVLVATRNCNFHNWNDLQWDNSFPWSDEVTEWLDTLDKESERFSKLLSSYQIRRN